MRLNGPFVQTEGKNLPLFFIFHPQIVTSFATLELRLSLKLILKIFRFDLEKCAWKLDYFASETNDFSCWAVKGEVTASCTEHISNHSHTSESMVSISSLPFNCSQLEHGALWRFAGAATQRHARRGHSAAPVRRCSRCRQGSRSVLVQFISESWVTRTQSFHRLSLEREPQLSARWKMRVDTLAMWMCAHICVSVWQVGFFSPPNKLLLLQQYPPGASSPIGCCRALTPDLTMKYLLQQLAAQCSFN